MKVGVYLAEVEKRPRARTEASATSAESEEVETPGKSLGPCAVRSVEVVPPPILVCGQCHAGSSCKEGLVEPRPVTSSLMAIVRWIGIGSGGRVSL